MRIKKTYRIILLAALLFSLPACSSSALPNSSQEDTGSTLDSNQIAQNSASTVVVEYDEEDLGTNVADADAAITLNGDSIAFEGSGALVNGNVITITSAGTYSVSGTLNNGQIVIDSTDEEKITLLLNGASITNATSAPLYVLNAAKTVIELVADTQNTVTDGATYVFENVDTTEPNAAIFSNDDLTIKGSGSLTVNANYKNGIVSDDDLKITGGTITINAVNDGIKGKSSVAVKDGVLTINAGGDGIQSTDEEDTEKGTVAIEGGTLYINATLDGIQAATTLAVSAGTLNITSGGGSVNGISKVENWGGRGMPNMPDQTTVEEDVDSTKGLKAGVAVTITGGILNIDSADDSIHANDSILVEAGELTLTSGDDGMHADAALTIDAGTLTITESYEGIESSVITINGGTLHITASDDGINVAGGNDASGFGGRPGQGNFMDTGNNFLYINDGYIYVDAVGDGIDSNGSIEMNAGTVLVNGPTNNGNGPLDYLGTFNLNGGVLVAAGSSGMAQAPSSSSTQYALMVNFNSMLPAATLMHFQDQNGQELITFVPAKEFQSILISTPDIQNGDSVDVYYGGSYDGSLLDGLYTSGTYSAGTLLTTLEISGVVTGAGSGGGMLPGGGGMPGGGGRGR